VDAPSDWTTQLSKTELYLAPGAHDASVSLIVGVPATTLAQNYTFEVTVINQNDTTYQRTVSITHSVLEGRQPPQITVDPVSKQALNGSTVAYMITIHNIDPPTFPTTAYRLDYTLPEGWTGMVSQSTVVLIPNTNASVILTVTAPGNVLPGEYSVIINATNTVDPRYVGSGTGSLTILRWEDVDFTPPTVLVTVTVGAPTPDQVTFNITGIDNTNGSGIYELQLYVDDLLTMTWDQAGQYTYIAGPFSSGTHTFYVEATDLVGNRERNPPRDYQRFSITPTIPWHFLLIAILLALSLVLVIYYGLNRTRY
jgi:hypothetical protein